MRSPQRKSFGPRAFTIPSVSCAEAPRCQSGRPLAGGDQKCHAWLLSQAAEHPYHELQSPYHKGVRARVFAMFARRIALPGVLLLAVIPMANAALSAALPLASALKDS